MGSQRHRLFSAARRSFASICFVLLACKINVIPSVKPWRNRPSPPLAAWSLPQRQVMFSDDVVSTSPKRPRSAPDALSLDSDFPLPGLPQAIIVRAPPSPTVAAAAKATDVPNATGK